MTQLTAGMPAPHFEGTDQNGKTVKLSSFLGKKVTGVIRTTFIIDEKGIIEKVIKKVDTKEHATQIFKLYENV